VDACKNPYRKHPAGNPKPPAVLIEISETYPQKKDKLLISNKDCLAPPGRQDKKRQKASGFSRFTSKLPGYCHSGFCFFTLLLRPYLF
jgi:hypothetical protein